MKSHLLVRVRLVCLLSEGVGVVMFPDMAALPVIAGLDHEYLPRGETDPAPHPALPLTQEPLGPLVVIVQEHGHSIRDETSHQGNIIILGNDYLGTINHLSIYRKADLVETPILTSPSQWRDENRIQTRARHTEKHHVLVVRKCILSSTLQGLISDTSTPGSILRVPDTANIFFSFNFFFAIC